jgi:hypothetical protein
LDWENVWGKCEQEKLILQEQQATNKRMIIDSEEIARKVKVREVNKICKIRNLMQKQFSDFQKKKFKNREEKEIMCNLFKGKYERIKLLERKCTDLEPEGLKVKTQLRTLRMKMLKETNQILNRNKKRG